MSAISTAVLLHGPAAGAPYGTRDCTECGAVIVLRSADDDRQSCPGNCERICGLRQVLEALGLCYVRHATAARDIAKQRDMRAAFERELAALLDSTLDLGRAEHELAVAIGHTAAEVHAALMAGRIWRIGAAS